jgi:transcriptional regulator with XRE-family HTH domain
MQPERFEITIQDVALDVEIHDLGAVVTARCGGGPTRAMTVPRESQVPTAWTRSSQNLRDMRKEAGLTLGNIARRLGIGAAEASAMERGTRKVTNQDASRWAEACGRVTMEQVDRIAEAHEQAMNGPMVVSPGGANPVVPTDDLYQGTTSVPEYEPQADLVSEPGRHVIEVGQPGLASSPIHPNPMTCPGCGGPTDELRGNRCKACREEA